LPSVIGGQRFQTIFSSGAFGLFLSPCAIEQFAQDAKLDLLLRRGTRLTGPTKTGQGRDPVNVNVAVEARRLRATHFRRSDE
jgi:hypothetical protein